MGLLWITDEEVKKCLAMGDALSAAENAFLQYQKGKVQMPPKVYLDFNEGGLRAMPAYLEEEGIAGVKIVNAHPNNPKMGFPVVMALLILSDPATGTPLAMMDATFLTNMRTGAAGGIAARYLARKGPKVLGLVGSGVQARTQLLGINRAFSLEEVKVASNSISSTKRFMEEMGRTFEFDFEASSIEDACDCDILVTTTPVRKPIVKEEWIKEGTHINAIGADAQGKEELDPEILKRSKIITDSLSQAVHSGEINVPISKGIIEADDIFCELGEVIMGRKGRESDKEITIFDSTGLAIQDVATGKLVYEKAKKEGLGTELKMETGGN